MIIADHCKPGGWRYNGEPYTPLFEWPENCYVQWGGHGVVFSNDGPPRRTAFFESFPDTFIRGEGDTVAEAEQECWKKFQHFEACAGHEYERRGYTNGAGVCKHCGYFRSKTFEPLPTPADHVPGIVEKALTGDLDSTVEILTEVSKARKS